jgi:hypothetical protein
VAEEHRRAPGNLIDLTEAEVEQKIGKPAKVSGYDWRYETPSGLLFVHFINGRVISISPSDYDVASFAAARGK